MINLVLPLSNANLFGKTCKPNNKTSTLRWDHCNLSSYYDLSRQLMQPIYDKLCLFYDDTVQNNSSPTSGSNVHVGNSNPTKAAKDAINIFMMILFSLSIKLLTVLFLFVNKIVLNPGGMQNLKR